MNPKQHLQQAFLLDKQIQADMLEIERLRALAESVPPALLADGYVKTGVPADKVGDIVAKIVDLETKLTEELDRYIDVRRDIRKRINRVENDELRLILQQRYLNFEKWEQIAVNIGCCYQWIYKMHRKALEVYEEAIESEYANRI